MAMNNNDRINKAFQLLSEGLADPVDAVMTDVFHTAEWADAWAVADAQKHGSALRRMNKNDVQVQLRAITEYGREFNRILSRRQQAYASELRDIRNEWAHMETFSSGQTLRALDTIELLLDAVNAPDSAADVRKLHDNLQRTMYESHTRSVAKRKSVSIDPDQGMKAWREVIKPHEDVASGRFTASEFAADLYQVAVSKDACTRGNAYGDPVEFFNRTYLTEGLKDLLTRAAKRLMGSDGSSPVVNLQTNFGGGKTHSLLALYHLFGDTPLGELSGDVQNLVAHMGLADTWQAGKVRRVAIVGTRLTAGEPMVKEDGTKVHTIWGELAWQLGGREAYDMVAQSDRSATPPGKLLQDLLEKYSPCLILIDEWVAYARTLVGRDDLPAGTFDDQFTFAQTLTETVATTDNCMLVVSVPASDSGAPDSDLEVGGENGRLALGRLQNAVRRLADQWQPSTKDESFEIVRKRLFEQPDAEQQAQIDFTATKFVDYYRKHTADYPSYVDTTEYKQRIKASYPLHPELLDRLYDDWSSLETFQRTRGVLTLVSNVIHELWVANDTSPMIMPGTMPLDTETVNANLTQYLRDRWKPIIDADIAGEGSTAAKIDASRTVFGQRQLAQRLARTIFMGSAPRVASQHPGISEQYVRLGTLMPGDNEGNVQPALSSLEQDSTYLFHDDNRYRYGLSPSINKTARDYAEHLRDDPASVYNEIARRLQPEGEKANRGKFRRVCVAPQDTDSIPDMEEATLVIMHPSLSMGHGEGQDAESMQWVRKAIEWRGSSQRVNRNMLVFLLMNRNYSETVTATARSYLGWKQVRDSEVQLNLTRQQIEEARARTQQFDHTLTDMIRNAYQWCVYPEQPNPRQEYKLAELRINASGTDSLAQRTGKRLAEEDQLIDVFSPSGIGYEILPNMQSSFKDGALRVGEIWQTVCRFPYMPRLVDRSVLDQAIETATSMPLPEDERFALAAGRDESTGRFIDLVIPGITPGQAILRVSNSTLIVQWATALEAYIQQTGERESETSQPTLPEHSSPEPFHAPTATRTESQDEIAEEPGVQQVMKEYFGTVDLDPNHLNKQLAQINMQLLEQLRLAHADIKLSLEIKAAAPDGFDENIVKIVKQNSEKLNLRNSGFEEEF